MNFKSKNKIDSNFNMSSMTDMVFLLLIFFMLTSNVVTPSGLTISLPTSKASNKVIPKINVSITKDLRYYVNETEVPYSFIEEEIANTLEGMQEAADATTQGVIVLSVDKDVATQHLVNVVGIATKYKAKVVISTLPE